MLQDYSTTDSTMYCYIELLDTPNQPQIDENPHEPTWMKTEMLCASQGMGTNTSNML